MHGKPAQLAEGAGGAGGVSWLNPSEPVLGCVTSASPELTALAQGKWEPLPAADSPEATGNLTGEVLLQHPHPKGLSQCLSLACLRLCSGRAKS